MEFTVPEQYSGISLKNFLRRECSVSARLLAKLRRTPDGISVNGKFAITTQLLCGGDKVTLRLPPDDTDIIPTAVMPDIVYEDDCLLVVNKPPYMPVHPVHEHQSDTLANAVAYYSRSRGEQYTFRAVNRLDRDTSGLVIIAKNRYAAAFLPDRVSKVYEALCEGILTGSGTIDLPIRIKEGHTIQREAGSGGVPAVTHYTALCSSYGHTLLRITLETGRTHQIRTHLSHIGHPLAGDDMYGGSTRYFDRQCLHCAEATLVHPVSRETLRLRCEPEPWLSMLSQYHQE